MLSRGMLPPEVIPEEDEDEIDEDDLAVARCGALPGLLALDLAGTALLANMSVLPASAAASAPGGCTSRTTLGFDCSGYDPAVRQGRPSRPSQGAALPLAAAQATCVRHGRDRAAELGQAPDALAAADAGRTDMLAWSAVPARSRASSPGERAAARDCQIVFVFFFFWDYFWANASCHWL